MRVTRSLSLAALALAAGGTLAACGGNSGYGSDGSTPPPSSATPTIEVSSTSLGSVLTDGSGRTLYLFTHDSGGSSACDGGCLSVWPPLTGTPTAGSGANSSLLGTITRSDGSTQATYAGHPLYYYSGDSGAGDVNGQEIQDSWYVVNASGEEVEGQATEAPSSDSGGGY
jgi:predicted lipoprotein with Yx(FWY)xxD motif